jgi:hypothetical protein
MYVSNHGNTPGLITQYHMEFHQNPPTGDQVCYRVPIDDTKTVVIMGPKEKDWSLEHLWLTVQCRDAGAILIAEGPARP